MKLLAQLLEVRERFNPLVAREVPEQLGLPAHAGPRRRQLGGYAGMDGTRPAS